jgi:heme/copper-type cytochrome/quinol oxidase subunit 2
MHVEDDYWREREERRRDRWAATIHTVVWTLCVIIIIAVLAYAGLYVFDHVTHVVRGY